MNKLILLTFLMLAGCNTRPEDHTRFRYGERVSIDKGLFEGCKGYVTDLVGDQFTLYINDCRNLVLHITKTFPYDFVSKLPEDQQ